MDIDLNLEEGAKELTFVQYLLSPGLSLSTFHITL
jgi:hypothetical protein